MTASGISVDEVIPCPGLGSGAAMSRLVEIVTEDGQYRAVQVAPDRLQFARTFRPTWAVVVGGLILAMALVLVGSVLFLADSMPGLAVLAVGVPVLLIGPLLFLVKRTETAVAAVEADHRGTRLRVAGKVDRSVMTTLRSSFADPAAAARDAAQQMIVGAPTPGVDPGGQVPYQPQPQAAPSGSPFPVVPPSVPPGFGATPQALPQQQAVPPQQPAPAVPFALPQQQAVPPQHAPPPPGPVGPPAFPAPQTASPPAPLTPSLPAPSPSHGAPPPVPDWLLPAGGDGPDQPADRQIPPRRPDSSDTIVGYRPPVLPDPAVALRLDDGTELPASPLLLVGRDPSPGEEGASATLIAIDDPTRSVSKTHLAVEFRQGAFWVTDRHSTNGTRVVSPEGIEVDLVPGEPTLLQPGARVRFGTRSLLVVAGGGGASS